MKILFLFPRTIGDITKAALTMKGMQCNERWNGNAIIAVHEDYADLVSSFGLADEVVSIKPTKTLQNFWKLRRFKFDTIVDMHGTRESAGLGRLLNKSHQWGFGDIDANIQKKYSNLVSFPAIEPSREHRFHHLIKNATGIHSFQLAASIAPQSEEVTRGQMFARQLQQPIIIAVQGNMPSQQWPLEFFVELCQWLTQRGRTPVLVGSAADAPKATTIIETSGMGISLCGNTTWESLCGMIMVSGVCTGVHSEAMYVADMLGAKVCAIFGPKSLALEGPVHNRSNCLSSTIKCAPCNQAICPTDNSCGNHIYPEDIIDTLKRFEV